MDIALTTYLSPSGLSLAGQMYFKMLTHMGFNVVPMWLMPPTPGMVDKSVAAAMLDASNKRLRQSALQLHVGLPQGLKLVKERSRVMGSVVVEGNILVPEQARAIAQMDDVLVPSFFCRNVLASSGVPRAKLAYLPYPLDADAWNPQVVPTHPKPGRFRFLYMNTWYERKGYDVLLRAWWDEFTDNDPVELVLKSYRESDRKEPLEVSVGRLVKEWGVRLDGKAPITIVDELVEAESIPGFMRSFDAYVSPHRSEGFGLNVWHAMSLGVPVICTDYSGTMDFAKDDTSWLVRVSEMRSPGETESATFPHLRGIKWAEPDVMDLRRRMRECVSDKSARDERARRGAALVRTKYDRDHVAGMFEQIVRKSAPESWDRLMEWRAVEKIVSQPVERFRSTSEPIRLAEL